MALNVLAWDVVVGRRLWKRRSNQIQQDGYPTAARLGHNVPSYRAILIPANHDDRRSWSPRNPTSTSDFPDWAMDIVPISPLEIKLPLALVVEENP